MTLIKVLNRYIDYKEKKRLVTAIREMVWKIDNTDFIEKYFEEITEICYRNDLDDFWIPILKELFIANNIYELQNIAERLEDGSD